MDKRKDDKPRDVDFIPPTKKARLNFIQVGSGIYAHTGLALKAVQEGQRDDLQLHNSEDTGADPDKPGNNRKGDHHPPPASTLAKVPPEVWEIIFNYLKAPEDVHTVMNTCEKWNGIMASKRTRILFPLVLPHIAPYILPIKILHLRLVSKTLRNCIDATLQNHGLSTERFEYHWWHTGSPFHNVFKRIELPYLIHQEHVTPFIQKFSDYQPQQNPFISRQLSIKFESGPNFRSSYDAAINLLQKFGGHLWDFTHFFPEMNGLEDQVVTLLPSVLSNLPNLKSLKIDWSTEAIIRVPPEILQNLRNNPGHQFPPLPHLTSINFDFRGGGEVEAALGIGLLHAYGPQLDTFICRGEFIQNPALTPDLIWRLLPNMKNLRIFCVTTGSLQKLSQLQGFPLERLQLWYSFHGILFKNVVRAVNAFASTLVLLHMDVKLNYPFLFRESLIDNSLHDNLGECQEILQDPEEMSRPFPKLIKLSAPASSINSNWFWELVKVKFKGLGMMDFQTAMESLFAPFERKYLKREVEQSKEFFKCMDKLGRIRFWFHNKGHLIIRR